MSDQQRRLVNVVPTIKVKKEVFSSEEEDDECVSCRLCNKTFAREVALRNHARMEHIDAFATGDPAMWTLDKVHAQGMGRQAGEPIVWTFDKEKRPSKEVQKKLIAVKTEEIISSMAPADLMTLASEDVSYIIVKAEESPETRVVTPRKRRAETVAGGTRAGEGAHAGGRRDRTREVQPITGPFECLQPSGGAGGAGAGAGAGGDGVCHQIFFSCCEYSVHFRDEHTRRRKGLRCQVCEKPLAGGEDASPFPCEVCGAGFNSNKELSAHMATEHVKLKPFECSVCHKRFTQQGGVSQHMRMHTGDRPFPCTYCGKAFTQKSGLDQHLRIHTKLKPYRCVICGKTFCQSVHLRQHMRTHTQVSPFQCGICQKRFKQSSHLNYHLKNHNQRGMTSEQRALYTRLVTIMNDNTPTHDTPRAAGEMSVVEIQEHNVEEQMEVHMEEQEYEQVEEGGEEYDEGEVYEVEGAVEAEVLVDDTELMMAEQSIQEGEDDTYILGDAN